MKLSSVICLFYLMNLVMLSSCSTGRSPASGFSADTPTHEKRHAQMVDGLGSKIH